MTVVARHGRDGAALGTADLDSGTFGVEPNLAVLHQVVNGYLAGGRAGTQSTLTRAEVRGGGSKPRRQKGTGGSRQGSIRAPHFVGGGVALGPKPRDYTQRTPKKMVALALRSALSDRAASGRVLVVDSFDFPQPRTKDAIAFLRTAGVGGRVLAVLSAGDEVARRSFSNLPEVDILTPGELNAYAVLRSDWVVFTAGTVPGGVLQLTGAAPGEAAAEGAGAGVDEPEADEPGAPGEEGA